MLARSVLRPVAAAALAALVAACAAGSTTAPPGTASAASPGAPGGLTRPTVVPKNLPACVFPDHTRTPSWLPPDLPFPPGTYSYREVPDSNGYHRVLMIVPVTLDVFTRFVLLQWPKSGWVLGRGDAEPGEIEEQFVKAPRVGAFKAVSEYCNPGFSRMLLVFAEQAPGLPGLPSPAGSTSPLNPSASPVP